ncbi:MAG: protoporphyrinogen oxidase [Planctomycetes bacterium]|nr:protoporphyrinogen oxidase [Planctomycetota bacterium]
MSEKTIVVGGGITGLAAALELDKRGEDFLLLEAGNGPGGVIRTLRQDGYLFERGPNSFPSTSEAIFEIARELGMEEEIIAADPAANTRFLYHKHRLIEIPTGPGPLMKSKLFSLGEKLRVMMEPFIRARRDESPESVAHFFARRFGPAPARTLVDAFISGIYAGDARKIGIRSAFPKLWEMEQQHGSIFKAMKAKRKAGGASPTKMTIHSFRDGLGSLADRVGQRLGERMRCGRRLAELDRSEGGGWKLAVEGPDGLEELSCARLILAAPARVSSLLLNRLSPMAADILADIDHAPIISVHAGFAESELPRLPQAFGFLAPRPSRLRTLGWLFSSRTFAGRAPEGYFALNGFIGGANDRNAITASDDALQHLLMGELSLALGMTKMPAPGFFALSKWDPGLPQYNMGHHRRIEAVTRLLAEHADLALAGNYLEGISIADCIKSGRTAVDRLLAGPVSSMAGGEA